MNDELIFIFGKIRHSSTLHAHFNRGNGVWLGAASIFIPFLSVSACFLLIKMHIYVEM